MKMFKTLAAAASNSRRSLKPRSRVLSVWMSGIKSRDGKECESQQYYLVLHDDFTNTAEITISEIDPDTGLPTQVFEPRKF